MTKLRVRRVLGNERGYTLAEMIVVSLVTTIILLAIGGMYISTIQAQRTVSMLTGTTDSAQLAARSIDAGVRNGVEIRPLASGVDGGQLLLVCTATAGEVIDYRWQAWYYSPSGVGEIRTRTFFRTGAPSIPSSAELESWTLLLSGVDARGEDGTVFGTDPDDDALVTIRFSASGVGDGAENINSATIDFESRLAPHPSPAPGSEPCT